MYPRSLDYFQILFALGAVASAVCSMLKSRNPARASLPHPSSAMMIAFLGSACLFAILKHVNWPLEEGIHFRSLMMSVIAIIAVIAVLLQLYWRAWRRIASERSEIPTAGLEQ